MNKTYLLTFTIQLLLVGNIYGTLALQSNLATLRRKSYDLSKDMEESFFSNKKFTHAYGMYSKNFLANINSSFKLKQELKTQIPHILSESIDLVLRSQDRNIIRRELYYLQALHDFMNGEQEKKYYDICSAAWKKLNYTLRKDTDYIQRPRRAPKSTTPSPQRTTKHHEICTPDSI